MGFRPAPLLPFVLVAACAAALALLTAGSARRGLPRVMPGSGSFLVRHSPVFRWFSLAAGVVVPVGLTVLLAFYRPARSEVSYLIGLYLFFAGLTTLLVWEAGRYYLLATPEWLEGRSAWRGTTVIRWDEFDRMAFRQLTGTFEFAGRERGRIRSLTMVAGLPILLGVVETRVPVDRLKPARPGYARIGRKFPALPDEPILEARKPR